MPVYKVGFWYTVYGTAQHIEADSAQEAEKWLYDELSQNGIGEFEDSNAQFEAKVNDREYGATDAEEVNNGND